MSYLYDNLRDALGGKTFKAGSVIKNWSPNEVRAIFIMRDFIFIADYIKQPKVIRLDVNEVGLDLMTTNRRGNLNNLLENRQLSCLEEIYVDSCFLQYSNVLNLQEYVQGMYNQVSRLRYFGYVRGFDLNTLENVYNKVLIDGLMDFTVAKNLGGFEYQDVENYDWYKKYNLRPQYYAIDGEKGKLSTYFSKCDKVIGDNIRNKEDEIKSLTVAGKVVEAFRYDINIALRVIYLLEYIKFLKGKDVFSDKLTDCLQKDLFYNSRYDGLTKEKFINFITKAKIPVSREAKYLLKLYQKVGIFDSSETNKEIDLDSIDVNKGLFHLSERLLSGLGEFVYSLNKKEYLLHVMLTSNRINALPDSALVTALKTNKVLHCNVVNDGNDYLESVLKFTYALGGFTEKDFIEYINRNRGA